MKPNQGFIAAAVRNFYTELSQVKHDHPDLVLKVAKICHKNIYQITFLKKKNFQRKDITKKGKEGKQRYQM